MNRSVSDKKFSSILITQAIAIVGFVIVPGLVTFIVPRTTVRVTQADGVTSAEVTKYVFLAVPLYTVEITPILSVEGVVRATENNVPLERRPKPNSRRGTRVGDGYLILHSSDDIQWHVQSTPAEAPEQAKVLNAFIEGRSTEPPLMTTTAGWMLTYLLGGAMTGLAGLYVVGATLAMVRWALSFFFWRNDSSSLSETK